MQCGSRPSGDKGKAADSPGSERHVHRAISAGVLALACMQDGRGSNTVRQANWPSTGGVSPLW